MVYSQPPQVLLSCPFSEISEVEQVAQGHTGDTVQISTPGHQPLGLLPPDNAGHSGTSYGASWFSSQMSGGRAQNVQGPEIYVQWLGLEAEWTSCKQALEAMAPVALVA